MVAAMLTVLPMQARAAINPKITISDLSLTPSNATGEEDPTKTAVQSGDYLKLKFSWDAARPRPRAGTPSRSHCPSRSAARTRSLSR